MKNVNLLIVGTVLFLQSCVQRKLNWEEYENKFAIDLKDELKSNKVTGSSYAVFDDKRVIWQDAYGYANKKTN